MAYLAHYQKEEDTVPRSQQPMNKEIIGQFRANHGQMVSGRYQGVPLLLLHTKGAKSGEERVNPMLYVYDDNRLIVIASNSGVPYHPSWYFNVLTHPEVTVELGEETFRAQASILQGEERDTSFRKIATRFPTFLEYEKTAQPRVIPLVELVRSEDKRAHSTPTEQSK